MRISDSLLPEFDHEMATTRKTLERIPEDKLSWAPHEKSMKLGRLAGHVAELPNFATMTITTDSIDLASGGYQPLTATSQKQVLDAFDKAAANARAAIAGATDEELMQPWTLLYGGKTIFAMPRVAAVRAMMMSHMIHHRGQLS
ncbi:MAG TPA: DinB family protein, partial [Bryobacteraceae bacterium]|nr:DinB family protein [Bryobacteraceae bacterium]